MMNLGPRRPVHVPNLLRFLANSLSSMDIGSDTWEELYVGGTGDNLDGSTYQVDTKELHDMLIDLAGDIAANDATFDEAVTK